MIQNILVFKAFKIKLYHKRLKRSAFLLKNALEARYIFLYETTQNGALYVAIKRPKLKLTEWILCE